MVKIAKLQNIRKIIAFGEIGVSDW